MKGSATSLFWAISLLTILSGCSSVPDKPLSEINADIKPRALYCANYLIYELCAIDVDTDGTTDALYFDDTKEVFMYDREHEAELAARFPMHACVQVMDDDMKQASNQILYITEDTPLLTSLSVQKTLYQNYSRYSGEVDACQKSLASSDPEPAFERDDDWDF